MCGKRAPSEARARQLELGRTSLFREFKDVVFEDVVFDNNSFVIPLYIICRSNVYVKSIITKHRILKHHILELPTFFRTPAASSPEGS